MTRQRISRYLICVMPILAVLLAGSMDPDRPAFAETKEASKEIPLTIEIRNRLYPEFYEVHHTTMHKLEQIGDTDYFYEVTEFYPHFAIIDSTKKVVSLSEDPKNTAFRITVYENDEVLENTWAFYHIDIPHFQRTSFLYFNVIEFEYRGELFSKKEKETQ